jgi:hypothetical protein
MLYGDSQLDRVIWCVNQILLRAQVPFRRLHRSVTEEQLDLLKLAAASPAQFGAGTAAMPHAA